MSSDQPAPDLDATAAPGGPGMRRIARQLRYRARYIVSLYPSIYIPYARRHYRGSGIEIVDRETDLVIEGFGRSGSTFAVDAFEMVQRRTIKIAHHTHAAAQVIAAVQMGIPTLVIVRDPIAATLAHMVRRSIPARPALVSWVRYHERLLPYRGGFVAGATENLSEGLGAMIRAVNEKFGADFEVFDGSKDDLERIFGGIEKRNLAKFGQRTDFVARPTPEREARKQRLTKEVESPRLARLRARARTVHRSLLAEAP